MRLNTEKTINQCRKGLYAKQLEQYATLCSIYKDLTELYPGETSNSVQARYASILSLASQSCLNIKNFEDFRKEMDRRYQVLNEDLMKCPKDSPQYIYIQKKQAELELIEQFAHHSRLLNAYKNGLDILSTACRTSRIDGSKSINKKVVAAYHEHMYKLPETKKYDTLVDLASYTMNGYNSYRTTKDAIQTIQSIDETHINPKLRSSITPSTFKANIKGFYRTIPNAIKQLRPKQAEHDHKLVEYPEDEKAELTIGRTIKEASIGLANHVRRFTTHNKKRVLTAALALSIFGYLGVHHKVSEYMDGRDHHFGNLASIDVLKNQSIVSDETKLQLISIGDNLNSLRFFTKDPTPEQLEQVKNDLDSATDFVMSDLVSQAFEKKFPEYTVSNVETKYDRTTAETDGEKCIITFVDKEGREHMVTVDNFYSNIYKSAVIPEILEPNPLAKSFDDEYVLDSTITDNIEYIRNSPDSSSIKTKETLNTLYDIYTTLLQLANGELVLSDSFFNGLELTYIMPETINVSRNNNPITPSNSVEQTSTNDQRDNDDMEH